MTLPNNEDTPYPEAKSQQTALMDLFLPDFNIVSSTASQTRGGNLIGYTRIICIFALAALLKPYIFQLSDWFLTFFQWTIHTRRYEETYNMIRGWIISRELDHAAQSALVTVGASPICVDYSYNKKPLECIPWGRDIYFYYGNNLLPYRTKQVDLDFHNEQQVSITCISLFSSILRRFMSECRREDLDTSNNKIIIHRHLDNSWVVNAAVNIWPLSTIVLHPSLKKAFIKNLTNILDPETKHWYSDHRTPCKRGYLLHGPSGTGQTSLIFSIASEIDINIHTFMVPNIDDQKQRDLFVGLPKKCLTPSEEIDRPRPMGPRDSNPNESDSERDTELHQRGATVSGVLSTLDAISSRVNWILIVTANHPLILNEDLIRLSRVDMKVESKLSNRFISKAIYIYTFREQEATPTYMENQATAFAAKVPEGKSVQ